MAATLIKPIYSSKHIILVLVLFILSINIATAELSIILPENCYAEAECQFDFTSDGSWAEGSWDFGDDTVLIGATPTHIYSETNEYTISLIVTDGETSETATDTLTVTEGIEVAQMCSDGEECILGLPEEQPSCGIWWTVVDYACTTNVSCSDVTADVPTKAYYDSEEECWANVEERERELADDRNMTPEDVNDTPILTEPVAVISTLKYDVYPANYEIQFNASESYSDNGEIFEYEWLFNNVAKLGKQPTYTFSEPGTYNISLTVTDNINLKHETNFEISIDEGHPKAIITDPQNSEVVVPAEIVFKQDSFDLDGSIVKYEWNFGITKNPWGDLGRSGTDLACYSNKQSSVYCVGDDNIKKETTSYVKGSPCTCLAYSENIYADSIANMTEPTTQIYEYKSVKDCQGFNSSDSVCHISLTVYDDKGNTDTATTQITLKSQEDLVVCSNFDAHSHVCEFGESDKVVTIGSKSCCCDTPYNLTRSTLIKQTTGNQQYFCSIKTTRYTANTNTNTSGSTTSKSNLFNNMKGTSTQTTDYTYDKDNDNKYSYDDYTRDKGVPKSQLSDMAGKSPTNSNEDNSKKTNYSALVLVLLLFVGGFLAYKFGLVSKIRDKISGEDEFSDLNMDLNKPLNQATQLIQQPQIQQKRVVPPSVINYVKQSRSAGIQNQQIKKKLIQQGWRSDEIQQFFSN